MAARLARPNHARAPGRARHAGIRPLPPYHRSVKRRLEPTGRHRPLVGVRAWNAILVGIFLLAACTAMPAGAAMIALQAEHWRTPHTIDLPAAGPLDIDLPQTATITSRDGTRLLDLDDVHYGRRTFI